VVLTLIRALRIGHISVTLRSFEKKLFNTFEHFRQTFENVQRQKRSNAFNSLLGLPQIERDASVS